MKFTVDTNQLIKKLLCLVLIIPYFRPAYVDHVGGVVYQLYTLALYLSIAVAYIWYLLFRKRFGLFVLCITVYESVIVLSTYLNHGILLSAIIEFLTYTSICMYVEIMLDYGGEFCMSTFSYIINVLVIINLLTIVIYPDGMYTTTTNQVYKNWFLGLANQHIQLTLAACFFSMALSILHYGKFKITIYNAVIFIAGIISIILAGKATPFLVACVIAAYFFLSKSMEFTKIVNGYVAIGFNLVVFIGIVILNLQSYFSDFITSILHRDLTFTGRTPLWELATAAISNNGILGHGVERITVFEKYFNLTTCHNNYLWIMYRVGFVGFFVFLFVLVLIAYRLSSKTNRIFETFCSIFLFCIMLIWQSESMNGVTFFAIYAIMYHCNRIKLNCKQSSFVRIKYERYRIKFLL